MSLAQKNPLLTSLIAFEALDSRGMPTVGCLAKSNSEISEIALVPSGASTGEHEALELRDGDKTRFLGKGVKQACQNIDQKIAPTLIGSDLLDLRGIDRKLLKLDGTDNKSNLGANATLAASLACARLGARVADQPLFKYLRAFLPPTDDQFKTPIPLVNVINGGAHATNSLDFQEFMLAPMISDKFSENIRAAAEVFHVLKKNLAGKKHATAVGDEGGFAPNLNSSEETLDILCESIELAGYQTGKDIFLALDVAASEMYDKDLNCYVFKKSSGEKLSVKDMIKLYQQLASKYPLISIEDGLAEDDWNGWQELTATLGSKLKIVGDDLFVTNSARLQRGIEQRAANSILIKLNQIGTVSETLDTIILASQNGFSSIISHRSGETEDTSIADLAVATNAQFIKTGSVARSERTAKYNRLLFIEKFLL
ncbi:MAG TPA: phosphopyruvate hydratase [Oligoflexia bacterium]|nr:phosphopyruvate hydratase [Oligoflexia bacterium]HMP27783.1 phosphopyruvate hydratase [Oligoflexia bacterium]